MREKLIQYVDLLFAGADRADEVKQEILQNTLDRYDDLIAQGKAPEAAYRLAISGIGDINEVLPPEPAALPAEEEEMNQQNRKLLTGLAIALYILCPVPLFILQNEIGLCLLLVIVAIATGILIWIGDSKEEEKEKARERNRRPETELERSINSLIGTVTLIIYLVISFSTGAWYITWVIFPLSGAVKGLIRAIIDLKEAENHEN